MFIKRIRNFHFCRFATISCGVLHIPVGNRVGVFTSYHDFNSKSGLRGQIKTKKVQEVLDVRNRVMNSTLGRDEMLLAKLDKGFGGRMDRV